MERLGSCARTRNLARNARRFALVPRGKQGGESVMQARCKPVAWAELRRSYGVAFVFASCSLRVLFVFSSYSLGVLHCFSREGLSCHPVGSAAVGPSDFPPLPVSHFTFASRSRLRLNAACESTALII